MHQAVSAGSYEQARQEQIALALKRFREQPSPENALVGHRTLLAFQVPEKAADLRREALVRFPGRAELLESFASHLDDQSARDEALPAP